MGACLLFHTYWNQGFLTKTIKKTTWLFHFFSSLDLEAKKKKHKVKQNKICHIYPFRENNNLSPCSLCCDSIYTFFIESICPPNLLAYANYPPYCLFGVFGADVVRRQRTKTEQKRIKVIYLLFYYYYFLLPSFCFCFFKHDMRTFLLNINAKFTEEKN